jgi:LuxR family maltose regulon positive regulatory protein
LAAPEGFIRIFLDEGETLLDLLPKARQAAPELVDAILGNLQAESGKSPLDQLPEPLSEQELRVLGLIVAGKTNREIADELVISVGTAKWHVHNILQKLGVSNRSQAIARARELGF